MADLRNTSYTLTRRHDGVVLETGVVGYMAAIARLDQHQGYDVIIHDDSETMEQHLRNTPSQAAQSGFDWI